MAAAAVADTPLQGRAQELFDEFVSASTCRAALWSFNQLCDHLQLDRSAGAERPLYRPIRSRLNYWKADALWRKLERRASQQEYQRGRGACSTTTCVVVGAGPCGLRTAVELGFLGFRVVLLEKRETFSRNNVLHLWPFAIHDLRGLGAKKFYGKFCAGAIDHISIRQLQLILLKVALLLGVEVHVGLEFRRLLEPPEKQRPPHRIGWRMEVCPKTHPVSRLDVDVIIGADGRRNTLPGFRRKEFRGRLAIAITANFRNRNSSAEAKVEEISGVASIFNQRFFQELRQESGIDLENIVYYKDDTHYFVMTAKKQSLLERGVILQDFSDTELLLSPGNVDQHALQEFARQAANFSTNQQLPSLDFALNHYGQPDVAMFDFTCMYASENAAMIRRRHGSQLLVALVGDSLLEPFWPMGTGIARGFLAALDSCWMIRSLSQGRDPLEVLSERESVYRLLPQTTPENLQKNFHLFTVDPVTRYVNVNCLLVLPAQVRHLVDTGEGAGLSSDSGDIIQLPPARFLSSAPPSNQLLSWCQQQTDSYSGVTVRDLTTSWRSGLALCALIHRQRPDLIDFESLDQSEEELNTQLALDAAGEFGIWPLMTAQEMTSADPDPLAMVMFLSQFYQLLKDTAPPAGALRGSSDLRLALITPAFLLSRLGLSPSRRRNTEKQNCTGGRRRRSSEADGEQQVRSSAASLSPSPVAHSRRPHPVFCFQSCDLSQVYDEPGLGGGGANHSRVRLIANQLQARLAESSTTCRSFAEPDQQEELPVPSQATATWKPRKRTLQQQQLSFRFREKIRCHHSEEKVEQVEQASAVSHLCVFCQRRVYLMERLSAEGFFFHRSCFRCSQCRNLLRAAAYSFHPPSGRFYCPDPCEPRPAERTASSDGASSHRTSMTSLAAGSSADSLVSAERRRSSTLSVMLERIELENSGSLQGAQLRQEPEEVPEETLNRFNFSLEDEEAAGSKEEEEEEYWEEEQEEEQMGDGDSHRTEFPPVSSAAGSDSALGSDSTPVTPPPVTTNSTASFVTVSGSAHDFEPTPQLPPGPTQRPACWQPDSWIAFDDISPEVPQRTQLLLAEGAEPEVGGVKSEEVWRRRRGQTDSHSFRPYLLGPPLQGGAGDLLSQLKNLGGTVELEVGGARGLLKAVLPGTWREIKKKTQGRANHGNAAGMTGSPGEEYDPNCGTPPNNLHSEPCDLVSVAEKVTVKEQQKPGQELTYVPHALAFKQAYRVQKPSQKIRVLRRGSDGQSSCPTEVVGIVVGPREASSLSMTETLFQREQEDHQEDHQEYQEDLDAKITRRVQRAARRTARQEQLKRLHKAQAVQRLLQQLEEKQRQLEERGVMVEKALRGEEGLTLTTSHLHPPGRPQAEEPLMQHWFHLVQQRNSLVRLESELLIMARQLELEDRQSRLQQELREKMAVDDHLKEEWQLLEERLILQEMLEVVEQRDSLESLLEEGQQDLELLVTQELGLTWS
ncbi:LOW QUALITY PROTEIN: protein-methionine sulfoxide oxidase mical3b [Nelusetta ayraudi]|uniref:LOW QUALITY PROTEIN: protein-methionine sulfoxide oxidase mical3b n=1 Tax=Nelusetta ayraudi TaxID=303726 RepID=UPI003F704CAB